jgi:hypothetical protein
MTSSSPGCDVLHEDGECTRHRSIEDPYVPRHWWGLGKGLAHIGPPDPVLGGDPGQGGDIANDVSIARHDGHIERAIGRLNIVQAVKWKGI